jgi:O-antigen ligase
MTNKTIAYIVSFLLCISICFNTKLSEAPPLFLSNLILFLIDTLLLVKIIFHLRKGFLSDIKQVFLLFIVISIIALLSYNNKNVVSVFPKLILGLFTYYSFSRYLLLYHKDIPIVLFGLCFGTALSPFFQIEVADLTSYNTTNRIKIDNLGNFNAYAFLIAVSLIISIYLLTKIKSLFNKILFIGIQSPLLIVLLLTLSRGGFFALVMGFVLYNFSVNKKTKIYLLLFTIFAIIVVGNILIQMDGTDLFLNRFLNSEKDEDFDSGRSIVYLFLLNDLFSSLSAFVFGFGFGAIEIDVSAEIPLISAHNTYLDVFYSCGVIGLVIFIRYLFHVYKNIKAIPKSSEKSITIALFGQLIFCFFYDSYWGATQIGWILSFLFALFWAQSQKSKLS